MIDHCPGISPRRRTLLGLSCTLLALPLAGCQQPALLPSPASSTAAVPLVRVTAASSHPWPRLARVQGSLVSDERAVVGAKVAGRVKAIHVDRGTPVREGDLLVELEPEEFVLRVQHAEAQVAQVRARLGLKPDEPEEKLDRLKSPPVVEVQALLAEERLKSERVRQLMRQSAAGLEELQRQDAALRVAEARFASALNNVEEQIAFLGVRKAELALARQQLADATLRAPFGGVVQERQTARGTYVQVGDPILTLVRTDPVRFHAAVPEREAARVGVNEEVRIYIEGQPEPLTARVTRVSPALDPASRSLMIEADLPNPSGRLRAGLFAWADVVVTPGAETLAVPETAVAEFAGVEKVWLVRNQQAEERRIVTGRRERGLVEILRGLSAGDTVLVQAEQGRPGPVAVAAEPGSRTLADKSRATPDDAKKVSADTAIVPAGGGN
jgi:RND family efflux transporter MFP subunit